MSMFARGLPCPDGHGALYELNGRLWCSANAHGGNGRHFTLTEVQEAMAFSGTGAAPKPETKERKRRSDAGRPRSSNGTAERAADAAVVARIERVKPQGKAADEPKAEKATSAPRAAREPKECLCGCGGMTKGGTFLPGHDARYHSAQRKLESLESK